MTGPGATEKFTYQTLIELCGPVTQGGVNALIRNDALEPTAGPGTPIAAVKYPKNSKGKNERGSINNYVVRAVDDQPKVSVTLLSKQGLLNHVEAAVSSAPEDSALNLLPRIGVRYPSPADPDDTIVLSNLELPHRSIDAHVLAAHHEETDTPAYLHPAITGIRRIPATNHRALLTAAPFDLIGGCWDSSNKRGQLRVASTLVGEITAVVADQTQDEKRAPHAGATRIDPLGAALSALDETSYRELKAIRAGSSDAAADAARMALKKDEKPTPSAVGLGGIITSPLNPEGAPDLVAVTDITLRWALSLNALRRMHFGIDPADPAVSAASVDVAETTVRAALVAAVLCAQAYLDNDLYLRAGTDLIMTEPACYRGRASGRPERHLAAPTVDEAEALLRTAVEELHAVGIDWSGQRLVFAGNPGIRIGDIDADADDSDENS